MDDDRKGLTRRVDFAGLSFFDWEVSHFPLDAAPAAGRRFAAGAAPAGRPAVYRGTFQCNEIGDTFLDLRGWGKGYVWINGRLLSRFWEIGPQQTLFLPGAWLRPGRNQVVVLDLHHRPGPRSLAGLTAPVLDELLAPAVVKS
jgi:beta-galactosidase